MENIKDALEYVVDLARAEDATIIGNDGREYYNVNRFNYRELSPKKYPQAIHLSTLKSLVDYVKSGLNGITKQQIILVVENAQCVEIYTENDEFEQRTTLVSVQAELPRLSFDHYLDTEQFNIMLQSKFVNSDDRDVLLDFASKVKVENGAQVEDNGVSQVTTIKNGAATLSKAVLPNPVVLRPYRTFLEVEQPASPFVFRMNRHGELALYEADGGRWKLEAKLNVAEYLRSELAGLDNIIILA